MAQQGNMYFTANAGSSRQAVSLPTTQQKRLAARLTVCKPYAAQQSMRHTQTNT